MSLVNRLKDHAGLTDPLPTTELDIDDALAVIKNSRRRRAIRYVVEDVGSGEVITLGELIDHIAQIEYGRDDVSGKERKRVYVGLYQTHVDDLVDAGALTEIEERKKFFKGPNAEALDAIGRVVEAVCGGDQ